MSSIGAIGGLFILIGLGAAFMAIVTMMGDALPLRKQRLEVISRKRLAGEPLTSSEELEAKQADFERHLPTISVTCLVVGSIFIFIT